MWQDLGLALGSALHVVIGMARRGKTLPESASSQPLRAKLLEIVRRRPGLRLCELWKAMQAPRGTTRYHLFVLERIGAIESTNGAGASRYFSAGTPNADALALLLRGRILDVAATVMREPGRMQGDLVQLLSMSRKVFREYADLLVAAGLLTEQRDWRLRKYFPTKRLESVLHEAENERGPAPDPRDPTASEECDDQARN